MTTASPGVRILSLLFLTASPAVAATTVTTVVNGGAPAKRVDITFLGDRYTTGDVARFRSDVDRAVAHLRNRPPWKEYWGMMNVHRVEIASPASTYAGPLGSKLNTGRMWQVNTAAVNRYARLAPDADVVIVLVNSTVAGGGSVYGICAVAYNGPWMDWIVSHEIGHQFARLADENDDSYGGIYAGREPVEANATKETARTKIKWGKWIHSSTPLPTPATVVNTVGLFESAKNHTLGIYRPKSACLMRSIGAEYCEVCREQIVRYIYREANPIARINQAAAGSVATGDERVVLTSDLLTPFPVSYVWKVDGIARSADREFTFWKSDYKPGNRTVSLVVSDATPYARGLRLSGADSLTLKVTRPPAVGRRK